MPRSYLEKLARVSVAVDVDTVVTFLSDPGDDRHESLFPPLCLSPDAAIIGTPFLRNASSSF